MNDWKEQFDARAKLQSAIDRLQEAVIEDSTDIVERIASSGKVEYSLVASWLEAINYLHRLVPPDVMPSWLNHEATKYSLEDKAYDFVVKGVSTFLVCNLPLMRENINR